MNSKELQENFDDVINVEFTAEMENALDRIAEDEIFWKDVLKNFYKDFSKDMAAVKKDTTDYKVKDKILDEKCPKCGKPLAIKHGRNGKFIGCTGFPDCDFTKSIVKTTGVKCPNCKEESLRQMGLGTEKIEEMLKEKFPDSNIVRMDRDTTTKKGSHYKIINDFIK